MRGESAVDARRAGRFADDQGAATVVAVAILGAVVALGVAVVGVLGASVAAQSAANAADASALAAADAVSGAVAGEPCTLAGDLARRNGATLLECRIEGSAAVVSVALALGPVRATASARAGPPGWGG
ncbi:Rv3654c family TadE-like protein [Agromyces kandeliae]|uniref:Helicase n=1 Tax=Agromyces kandeliae TaxID=2666141 RepID=A0A6L5R0D4_9MICO|nr:Rv3654c family TadE-like protein [Agromyces kandeliae]MRX43481.1 helicase [Agromyces kandeliae]